MASVYPHIPVAQQLAAIDRANQTSPKKSVTILGAGIAGLAAAALLKERGHRVVVLEASDRAGGRIMTHYFPDGGTALYGELGAMRIPATHDYTLYFIDRLKLATRKFVTAFDNDLGFLDMRGIVARMHDGASAVYPKYRLTQWEAEQYPAGAIFGQQLSQLMSSLTDPEVRGLFEGDLDTERLQRLERVSLGEFVRETMRGADTPELVGAFTMLEGWWDKAITMFLRDQMVDTSDGLQEIVGGTSLLPDGLAHGLAGDIQYRIEATGIEPTGNGVTVIARTSDGATINIPCDYALCTIPFPVLRRMDLVGLGPEKMRAINEMNYAAATKVLLRCRERFWETKYGIFGGASISDRISRSTYYPSDHADLPERAAGAPRIRGSFGTSAMLSRATVHPQRTAGGPGVLLASYTLGQDALRLGALDPAERAQVVMRSIARFHPEILEPGMVIDSATIAWHNHPWSVGAFAFLWPGQLETLYRDAIAPAGRLFFAGEHCSTDQAWIQGALISSLREVLNILTTP